MRSAAGTAAADLGCVLLFVLIGRANHHAGGGPAGLWDTFWPFAAGAVAGLLATRSGGGRPCCCRPASACGWARWLSG